MNEFNNEITTENTEEITENIQTETKEKKRRKKKSSKGGIVAALLIFSLSVGTVVGYNTGQFAKQKEIEKSVISSTDYASVRQEVLLEQIAQKEGQELTTEEIAIKVGPAIVGIVGNVKQYDYFGQAVSGQSSGSGVIISADGYIVTNYHVIEKASDLKVLLNAGKEYTAEVVGYDEKSDIAVIKIEEKELPFVTFGDSSAVLVGERAIAIGNPLGTELMGTVTQGIISAVNRTVTVEDKTMTLIQTDAAINNGNSGGALLNSYGELIGINTIKMAAAGVEGLGFAIPSNQVKQVVDDVINYGYVRGRLIIGISGTNITEKLSVYYDLPVGIYVSEVIEGYGAYLAGIRPGDVIIKCDGTVIKTIDELNAIRDTHKVGETISLTVVRGEQTKTFDVKLMEEKPNIR